MDRTQFVRRTAFAKCGALAFSPLLMRATNGAGPVVQQDAGRVDLATERMRGLLIGGLLGDALGGPIEFADHSRPRGGLVHARSWSDDAVLNSERLERLSKSLPLNSYEQLRPEPAPYGPWPDKAYAGTVTDDSRHKIVLLRALRQGVQRGAAISVRDLAQAYIDFVPGPGQQASAKLSALNEEGFREYRFAARWLLGERDLNNALPVERLWAGVNNCSGQMMLPPLACVFPGDPKQAYRRAFELDFVDSPMARDMAAALVAGLSTALVDPEVDVRKRWQNMIDAMRQTDPYRQAAVPFAGRQLDRWLDRANSFVDRAQGSPKRMYAILESEGKPEFWWDAHFTLLVPLCMIRFCDFDPLAAMHLTLDFGHDTDSYAQVLGCMTGAVHGYQVFPESMRQAVQARLRVDYGESVDVWIDDLQAASNLEVKAAQ